MKTTTVTILAAAATLAGTAVAAPAADPLEARVFMPYYCPTSVNDYCHAKNAHSYCNSLGEFHSSASDTCSKCYCMGTCSRCASVEKPAASE